MHVCQQQPAALAPQAARPVLQGLMPGPARGAPPQHATSTRGASVAATTMAAAAAAAAAVARATAACEPLPSQDADLVAVDGVGGSSRRSSAVSIASGAGLDADSIAPAASAMASRVEMGDRAGLQPRPGDTVEAQLTTASAPSSRSHSARDASEGAVATSSNVNLAPADATVAEATFAGTETIAMTALTSVPSRPAAPHEPQEFVRSGRCGAAADCGANGGNMEVRSGAQKPHVDHRQQQQQQMQGQWPGVAHKRLQRVSFSFNGMEEDASQLSLVAGDLVRVQCRDPSGWTYGRLECVGGPNAAARACCVGAAGWFPDAVLGQDPSEMAEELEAEQNAASVGSATTSARSRSQKGSYSSRSALTDKLDSDLQDAERANDRESAQSRPSGASNQHLSQSALDHSLGEEVSGETSSHDAHHERKGSLQRNEKRLAECARSRQRYIGVKENADRGILEAELILEAAERQYRALDEQERRCRAEACCIAGSSSSSLRRNWEAKLRLLEAKREVASQNLRNAQERLHAEKEAAANARRRLRNEQQAALAAMDAVTRNRGHTRAHSNGLQGSAQLCNRAGPPSSGRSASQASLHRAASASSITAASAANGALAAGSASSGPGQRPFSPSRAAPELATSERVRQRASITRQPASPLSRTASAGRVRPGGGGGASPGSARGRYAAPAPLNGQAGNPLCGRLVGTSARNSAPATGGAPPPRMVRHQFAFGGGGGASGAERGVSSHNRSGSRGPSQERPEPQTQCSPKRTRSSSQSARGGRSEIIFRSSQTPEPTASSARLGIRSGKHADSKMVGQPVVSAMPEGQDVSEEELSVRAADLLQTAEELQAKLESMPAPLLRRLAEQSAGAGSSAETPVPAEWCNFRQRLRGLLEVPPPE